MQQFRPCFSCSTFPPYMAQVSRSNSFFFFFRINEDIEEGQNGRHVRNGGDSMLRSSSSMKIFEPDHWFSQSWRIIFGVSCVIAIAMDPLFFYVPVIDEDKKCIGLDKKLRTTAIILRSVTDIIGVINIILQFHSGYKDEKSGEKIKIPGKIARRYLWPYFLIDILVILPFPQVRESFLQLLVFIFIFYQTLTLC